MLGWAPSMKAIRDFVKIRLRYSYKRGATRFLAFKKKELPYIQSVFSSRILQNFQIGLILINFDESTFTRSLKWDYSWFPKGKSHLIINSSWIGRASMIFAMLSNGEWIWTLKSGTIKSEYFIKFLLIFEIYIRKSLIIDKESTLITLEIRLSLFQRFQSSQRNFWASISASCHLIPDPCSGGVDFWSSKKKNCGWASRQSDKFWTKPRNECNS